jgi:hypothetical protein
MVYWLPAVTPDPIAPLYASVTTWPAASWNPPSPEKLPKPPGKPREKFPGKVLEKLPEIVWERFPDREVREKDVELKERVKLNPAAATGLRVLLLCTRNTAAPAKQAGSANPLRFCPAREVVFVVEVDERHPPLPRVTSNEPMDNGCDPMFWMVTKRELLESAALLISRLPWLVELMPWLVETTGMFGC